MILVNTLGIQDSGGITVLDKLLDQIKYSDYKYLIICNQNQNIKNIIAKFSYCDKFEFLLVESNGFIARLYYENIIFRKIIKARNIKLVYNFSGTSQFFSKIPQMTKVHNLLFYSKKIDKIYFEKKEYLKWFKQTFIKRIVFHNMLKQTKYIEVQSVHVKNYISDFIDISEKEFFIKSDISITKEDFSVIKNYDFRRKIKFLFIVGPHFEYLHKNFEDFVKTMLELEKIKMNFEINITLTQRQLHDSILWDKSLDSKTNFLGYISQEKIKKQFTDNTILISTSIIETLGLHVIEAIQNGVLFIVPNESYSKSVYGEDLFSYELFDIKSLINTIKKITLLTNNDIKDIITKNQYFLINNENIKYHSSSEIFYKIMKDQNVQK